MTGQLAGAASPGTAWRSWRLMVGYARPHRWGWSGVFLVTVASTAAALLEPWPMKVLADNVLGHRPLTSFPGFLRGARGGTLLAWVVTAGVVLFALTAGLEALLSYAWTRLGQSMVYDLASDLFARLQRRSLVASARGSVGDDVARITGDSWVVHTAIDSLLFAPAHALLVTIGMVVLMSRLDPLLAILAVATAPLMTLSAGIFGGRTRRAGERRRLSESSIQAHVQHALSGLLVIQAFGQEERERTRFSELAGAVIGSRKGTTLADQLNILASGLAATLGGAVVLWVGADHVISGQTTVGALLVFLSYQLSLQSQLKAFPGVYSGYQAARASLVRVTEILDAEVEPAERPGAPALPPVGGHVRLESVAFGYEPDRPVLKGVDLEALPGQTVAIVGASGAGKSTLVSLIPRFADPWSGRVSIDGHDVSGVSLASLRSQVSVVLQESFLFPMSVADNIAYGRPDATQAEVDAAARAANAEEFISALPDGYDTVVGERGATLSGGERQRIAIARALLKDAPVLILDEPTSALDAASETALLDALERLMAGRTTFVIAHRLSTIRGADRIAVLEDGRIAEIGTHDQLLAAGGIYGNLVKLQVGGGAARRRAGRRSPAGTTRS